MNALLIRIGNFLFRFRNKIFPVFMVVGVVLIRPRFAGGDYRRDLWVDAAGLIVCLSGQALRVVTIGYDYIKRGGVGQRIWADRLVQGGLFAHSRNPLYLGNILLFCGLLLILSAPVGLLIGVPAVLFVYWCIILAEEQYLRGKFGADYDAYCARVNRFWPNLAGFSGSVKDMNFRWRRVLNKEYNTTFAWIFAAVALRSWTLYTELGATARPEIRALCAALPVALIAYLWIRVLKKTGRLEETPAAPPGAA
jgi:protein-S-isoprenylcysteine O-methyltransferase Ste14